MFKNEGQQNIKNIAVEHQTKQPDFFHTLPEIVRERLRDKSANASQSDSPARRKVFVWLSLIGIQPTLSPGAAVLLKELTKGMFRDVDDSDSLQRHLYLIATLRQAGIENTASPERRVREAIVLRLNEMATREDGRGLASLLFLAKIAFPEEVFINDTYRHHIRDEIAHVKSHGAVPGIGGVLRMREVLAHCRLVDPSMLDLSDDEKAHIHHYELKGRMHLNEGDVEQLAYARLLAADDVFVDTEGVHVVDHAASATPQTKEMPSARRI